MSTPVVSLEWFTVRLTAKKPTRETNWKVQYFDGDTALTTASLTVARRVTLTVGEYLIQARWTKPGRDTVLTGVHVEIESYSIRATSTKPTSSADWKVQFFNAGEAVTNESKTYGRRIELLPGEASIQAVWTKVVETETSAAVEFEVGQPEYDPDADAVEFVLGDPTVNEDPDPIPEPDPDEEEPPIAEPPNPPNPPVPPPPDEPDPVPDPPPPPDVEPEPPPPAPTPSGDARLITSADLQYLGAMRCQVSDTRMDFSYGQMAGRRVGGKVRLFMSGNVLLGDPVFEFEDTESYAPTPATAPRMTLIRNWGNIYGTKRVTWDSNGDMQPVAAMYPGGMYWHEERQLLYWTYANSYNVSQLPDWCLGASALHSNGTSTAYGPWRPEGTRIGPRACLRVAMSPSGEMLCGATLSSGNASSPWGPDLHAGAFPSVSTPTGFNAPNIELEKYLTYYPMIGSVNANGSYTPPLTACRRAGDYVYEPTGGIQSTIDPTLNSGIGAWTELDVWGGVTWIDLADRYGVIFTGKLAAGHVWYSNAGNNYTCAHGLPSPVAITGPVATEAYPTMWIYDPNDLIDVRNGDTTDYTVEPAETINAEDEWDVITAHYTLVGSSKSLVGQYFDEVTRRLYVAAPEADWTIGGLGYPLVHVWLVN